MSPQFTHRLFKYAYWLGLSAAIFLTFSEPWLRIFSGLFGTEWTLALLIGSVSHVLGLAMLGFYLRAEGERALCVHAGEQVQTAGYLHTLIGFGAALLVFDPGTVDRPGDLQLTQVLNPIGSALVTSILGWFLGGEIIGRESVDDVERAARDQLVNLLNDLDTFMQRANEHHEEYLATLQEMVGSQKTLRDRQQKALGNAVEMGETVNDSLAELNGTTQSVREHLTSLSSALEESLSPSDLRDALSSIRAEAQVLREALEGTAEHASAIDDHLNQSQSSAKHAREHLSGFATEMPEVHEQYTSQVHEAREAVSEVADAVSELRERQQKALGDAVEMGETVNDSLTELDGTTRSVREHLTSISNALEDGLAPSGFRDSLDGVRSEAQALRKALESTAEHASAIDDHLGQSRSSARHVQEDLNDFMTEMPEVHERYASRVEKALEAVDEVADAVNDMLQKAREDAEVFQETPELLAPIRQATSDVSRALDDVRDAVDDVEASARGVTGSLADVNSRGADIEDALSETEVMARRMTKAIKQSRQLIDEMIQERYHEQNEGPQEN